MIARLGFLILLLTVALAAPAGAQSPFSGAVAIDLVMTRDAPAKRPPIGAQPETCIASQYGIGDGYHGRRAACGAIFNTWATQPFTAAHRSRACGSMITVTNLNNGLSIRARVTDRGPFIKGRCVDLGRAGANALRMGGTARVRVE